MAKANAETSFWGELPSAKFFKPSQGRIVRQVTGVIVALVFVLAAWRTNATLLADIPDTVDLKIPFTNIVLFPNTFGSVIRVGIPALIALAGCWLAFRLVNWPPFANFLISVEAEMDKVSWASLDYLKRATAVVLVCMVVLGGYLFLCDVIWQQLFRFIHFLDPKAFVG